ncbi:glycosyltransferase family A protein [Armatimonas sp.]|uniref:glycosyltransferase family 2 protein n=1 Tax=Armatimonas sp. TaxID=1872638 RepID=UPI00286BB9ED|nr:glycosyltransferase family A protein [Armatimonas sp.]
MNESSILISVVIPTRHRNDLLKICLDQLTPGAQTFPADQYEVIVTDDGSESTAEAFLKEDYPWVRWVAGPRKGPGANRNFGVEHAHGEWIAFTDDDCIPKPSWLEGYANALNPDTLVYEGQTICEEEYCPLTHETPVNITGGVLWPCNFLVQKIFFQQFKGFDASFPFSHEDADFRERLRSQSIHFPFVPEAIVMHPPRKKRPGIISGKLHEGYAVLYYKTGNRGMFTLRLIKIILKSWYYSNKLWGQLSLETFISLVELSKELACVIVYAPRWSRKYYLKYKDKQPTYHFQG